MSTQEHIQSHSIHAFDFHSTNRSLDVLSVIYQMQQIIESEYDSKVPFTFVRYVEFWTTHLTELETHQISAQEVLKRSEKLTRVVKDKTKKRQVVVYEDFFPFAELITQALFITTH